jgi:diaminohydroxyphosphoribosylaminopyrimidine deaminase / 5-amino-6-(5-phosphoribosylamino)uracil reductase
VSSLDRLYMERACELARRAIGNTSPNPPVGAVIVRDATIVGEGYHHRAGEPHAEIHALRVAGELARGATLYISLEPCNHYGRTPPCSHAVVEAGIGRVVIGARDPNPKTKTSGIRYLQEHAVTVELVDYLAATELIEPFARSVRSVRPYVSLKMAMSLDGFAASQRGTQEWITGEKAREYVRDLRIAHDAVAVGAGTVRVDNPLLTVRPAHTRLRKYVRVVLCESDAVDPASRIFTPQEGYAPTIVVAPAGAKALFGALQDIANVMFVGADNEMDLDVHAALSVLLEHDISSVLCEGGPTMAGHLLAAQVVDRFHWIIAPRLLRCETALPVVTAGALNELRGLRFDRVEPLGRDLVVSGKTNDSV